MVESKEAAIEFSDPKKIAGSSHGFVGFCFSVSNDEFTISRKNKGGEKGEKKNIYERVDVSKERLNPGFISPWVYMSSFRFGSSAQFLSPSFPPIFF